MYRGRRPRYLEEKFMGSEYPPCWWENVDNIETDRGTCTDLDDLTVQDIERWELSFEREMRAL